MPSVQRPASSVQRPASSVQRPASSVQRPADYGTPLRFARGFSLSELLVSLAIVGTITALTLPALMQPVQQMQLKSKGRLVVSQLQQVLTQNFQTGERIASAADYFTYVEEHLNATTVCAGNEPSGPCYTSWYNHIKKLILPNGALVGLWSEWGWPMFLIDLNGAAGPNKWGAGGDRTCLAFNSSDNVLPGNSTVSVWTGGHYNYYNIDVKPGQLAPCDWFPRNYIWNYLDWWDAIWSS